MNAFLDTLRNLGPARLAAIGAAGLTVLALLVYLAARTTGREMGLLYTDLPAEDAAKIVSQLEASSVPYELRGDREIHVPAGQVDRLRLAMAEQGLPSTGSIGYEIFDKPAELGTTSFAQQITYLRALEGEIVRTIQEIEQVRRARVNLVLPKRELFSREQQEPSASVVLVLRPGASISRQQVEAIKRIVAGAVSKLDPGRITIIDDRGNLLASGGGDGATEALALADEMERNYEIRLAQRIEELIGQSVGFDAVRAEVSVDLNFDQISMVEETFDPDGRVLRSAETIEDETETTEMDGPSPVTVGNQLPTSTSNTLSGALGSSTRTSRSEEVVNYEINKRVRNQVVETGQVRRLSVSVLVDGTYATSPDGERTYTPRTQAELDQIQALVRTAVGFDSGRGDLVEVQNMRFVTTVDYAKQAEEPTLLGLPRSDVLKMVEMTVFGIVAILVILLVVRPLISKAFERREDDMTDEALLAEQALAHPQLAPPTGALAEMLAMEESAEAAEMDHMIDMNRVEGRVRASSLRKIGEIVENHPEEAVAIIRAWMYAEN